MPGFKGRGKAESGHPLLKEPVRQKRTLGGINEAFHSIAWPREMDADIAVSAPGGGAVVAKELAELGYNGHNRGRPLFYREDFNLNPLNQFSRYAKPARA